MKKLKTLAICIISITLFISFFYGLAMSDARAASSGKCGENLTWKLDASGTLTISGTGDMYDYFWDDSEGPEAPWGNSYSSDVEIKKVIIKNGVASIGDWAFYECQELVSVEIPASVKSIGEYAFSECQELTSVEIPSGAVSIGEYAFVCCYKLTSVEVPATVTNIGNNAFFECSKLTRIDVNKNNNDYSSTDGIVFNKSKTEILIYPYGKPFNKDGSFTIPSGVKAVGSYAFYHRTDLEKVEIPASVKSIGDSAFECCSVENVKIPDSVTSIGDWAFMTYSLKNVVLGKNVESIGDGAFCQGDFEKNYFRSVMIPKSVKSIGKRAFGFWFWGDLMDDDFTVYGFSGTASQTYAKENGFEFISLDKMVTLPILVNTAKGIKVTFDKVDGATHYEVRRRLKASEKGDAVESEFSLVTTIPDSINSSSKINYYDSATASGKNGNTYVYYIRPLVKNSTTGSIEASGSTKNAQLRRVATPAIKSCTNTSSRAVTIKWSKNSLATGYDVWYSDGKASKSIRIKNKAALSRTVKGLTKGKTYTFKVRGIYITASGTVFKSAWKSAKVKIVR